MAVTLLDSMPTVRPENESTQPSVVVIDAGHGGNLSRGGSTHWGIRGPRGTLEKDVTLKLAHRVAAHFGSGALLTRTDDTNLTLAERSDVARRHNAKAFVSLHANGGSPGRGAEMYVHSRAATPSRALAQALQRELTTLGRSTGAVESAELAVLTPERLSPGTAACLLEVDYLSDAQGEERLRDPGALDHLGCAIATGIRRHISPSLSGPREAYGRVVPSRVICDPAGRDAAIITGDVTDPIAVITAANERAVELLGFAIDTLAEIRKKVVDGAAPAWPTFGDAVGVALRDRLRINPEVRSVWTEPPPGRPGTVAFAMRWLGRIRELLDGGDLWYRCLARSCGPGDDPDTADCCDPGSFAYVIPGDHPFLIRLCMPFWNASPDDRALTLIHETSHIYYDTKDKGGGMGVAECIAQFVADLNGITIDPQFAHACRPPTD